MSIFDVAGRVWTLARKIEELLSLQVKMNEGLDALEKRVRALEDKMIRFEAEQEQIITKAQAAANVAAVSVAGATMVEIATRLTKLEMQQSPTQARLPPT